jgi:RNA polymerase sigma-70 factor (ECF subfamily)
MEPCQVASSPGDDRYSDCLDLEQVYMRFLDPVYRFLYTRVGNREDAEDLASQVFLKAFRQLDVARSEPSIARWLFTVARTVLADHWRQEYRHGPWNELTENLIDRIIPTEVAGDSGKEQRVDEILALLPPRYCAVLELRFLHAYTAEETAQTLGLTAANVKVIQHRALVKAAQLAEDGVEGGTRSGAPTPAIA